MTRTSLAVIKGVRAARRGGTRLSVAGEGRNRGELSQANRLMGALSAWRAATLGDSWRLRVSLLRRHNFVHLRAQKKGGGSNGSH